MEGEGSGWVLLSQPLAQKPDPFFVCWLFRKTFWKEIAFPFLPSTPLFSPFLAVSLPFLYSKSLALPSSLPASPSPAPSLVKLLLIHFISPHSLVYRGPFVLVGELSNLIKVRDAIPGLVCPACWPCSLINSQGVRCAVLLCSSFFPVASCSVLRAPGARGWENTPVWPGDQTVPKYTGKALLGGLISAFLGVHSYWSHPEIELV